MGCPSCGATERRQVAPTLWECNGILVKQAMEMVPDENGPRAPNGMPLTLRPQWWQYEERCATRYAEGPPPAPDWPKCACGTYSIGDCAACGAPVCDNHSTIYGEQRLCAQHLQAARDEAARRQKERAAADAKIAAELQRRDAAARAKRHAAAVERNARRVGSIDEVLAEAATIERALRPQTAATVLAFLAALTAWIVVGSVITPVAGTWAAGAIAAVYLVRRVHRWYQAPELRARGAHLRLHLGCGSPGCTDDACASARDEMRVF